MSNSVSNNNDVLIGKDAITAALDELGFPDEDVYYPATQKRWGIGKYGKYLLTTKSHLGRRAQRILSAPQS
jgi:hypothetical protein